ncbi:hypothetical protein LJC27_06405 [Christensenellaceae bacterium OttesenSCG-928-M15]|nr:hypothetical protein [Christensenellaceae bacterium OttesenSCG-928-M15]
MRIQNDKSLYDMFIQQQEEHQAVKKQLHTPAKSATKKGATEDPAAIFERSHPAIKYDASPPKRQVTPETAEQSAPKRPQGDADAPAPAQAEPLPEEETVLTEEETALLNELEKDPDYARLKEQQKIKERAEAATETGKTSSSKPNDESGLLIRRLVAAQAQMEVVDVIGKAMRALASARPTASGDSDDAKLARAIVKRLLKVVQRGQRKIRDLNHEDNLRLEETREKRRQNDARVKEIQAELRKKVRARKRRERKYLQEEENRNNPQLANSTQVADSPQVKLDAASEAQIAAQAQAQAAIETSVSMSTSGSDISMADSGVSSSSNGGDAPTSTGGDTGGEIDVSV